MNIFNNKLFVITLLALATTETSLRSNGTWIWNTQLSSQLLHKPFATPTPNSSQYLHKHLQHPAVCSIFTKICKTHIWLYSDRGRQRKRWEDNIREWKGLEFSKSQRAVENKEKWRKLVAKSSVVPQCPWWLRDYWWWWWWWWHLTSQHLHH